MNCSLCSGFLEIHSEGATCVKCCRVASDFILSDNAGNYHLPTDDSLNLDQSKDSGWKESISEIAEREGLSQNFIVCIQDRFNSLREKCSPQYSHNILKLASFFIECNIAGRYFSLQKCCQYSETKLSITDLNAKLTKLFLRCNINYPEHSLESLVRFILNNIGACSQYQRILNFAGDFRGYLRSKKIMIKFEVMVVLMIKVSLPQTSLKELCSVLNLNVFRAVKIYKVIERDFPLKT